MRTRAAFVQHRSSLRRGLRHCLFTPSPCSTESSLRMGSLHTDFTAAAKGVLNFKQGERCGKLSLRHPGKLAKDISCHTFARLARLCARAPHRGRCSATIPAAAIRHDVSSSCARPVETRSSRLLDVTRRNGKRELTSSLLSRGIVDQPSTSSRMLPERGSASR